MAFERTENLKSFDGNTIFFRCFTQRQGRLRKPRVDGLIVAVHGFGEHSGRYAEIAEKLAERNVALATFDLRGHGKSGPRRGDAENLHAMVLDVLFVISQARGILGLAQSELQFYGLLGHSFGAVLLTYAAALLRDSCPPIFLSSPLFRVRDTLPTWKKMLIQSAPIITSIVPLPMRFVPTNTSAFGYDPEKDPEALTRVSPRLGNILVESANSARARTALGLIRAPISVVGGGKDELVDVEWLKGIGALAGSPKSTCLVNEEAGHNLLNSQAPGYDRTLELLDKWISGQGVLA